MESRCGLASVDSSPERMADDALSVARAELDSGSAFTLVDTAPVDELPPDGATVA